LCWRNDQLNGAIIGKVGRVSLQCKISGLNNDWIKWRAIEVGSMIPKENIMEGKHDSVVEDGMFLGNNT